MDLSFFIRTLKNPTVDSAREGGVDLSTTAASSFSSPIDSAREGGVDLSIANKFA